MAPLAQWGALVREALPSNVTMRPSWQAECLWFVVAAVCLAGGCSTTGSELDLTTSDPRKDQLKIAELYRQEATKLRQMAEDLFHRALVYERLFGPKSDWVEGTRLLAQSYEEAATQQERRAEHHRALVRDGSASLSVRPVVR